MSAISDGYENNLVVSADGRVLGANVTPIMWATAADLSALMTRWQSHYAGNVMVTSIVALRFIARN